MFRVATQMKWDKVDVAGTRFVKNVDGNLLIEPGSVAGRWKEYFSRLLNEESENQIETSDIVSGPIEDITREEVEVAVKRMKNKRATGPFGVAVEMFKGMGEIGIDEITEALGRIVRGGRMPFSQFLGQIDFQFRFSQQMSGKSPHCLFKILTAVY